MNQSLSQYSTLSFDCYGTLIDWESGIWDALQPLIYASQRDDIGRKTGLETFAKIQSAQETETPDLLYPELLKRVHRTIAQQLDLETTDSMDQTFSTSVAHWPAFADSADALRILKKHFKLVILSNVNRDGFAASAKKLGVEFDAIYTAEDVGSYKPNPRNFKYMLERLKADHGIASHQILHTAQSLYHDHVPATAFHLAKAWIDRQGLQDSENWGATVRVKQRPQVDFVFSTLGEMAAQLGNPDDSIA
ncbi:MAG: haloacid dehalogenase type II [Proteobacteria bacterium]|nr:haloacid dehalogenase type II [Pseudomonadota bacterium]